MSKAAVTKPVKERLAVAEQLGRCLSVQVRKFVQLLAQDPTHNQTKAAIGAKYKDPKTRGSRLMARADVRAYYEALLHTATELAKTPDADIAPPPDRPVSTYSAAEQLTGAAMDGVEVVVRLSDHARVNMLDFVSYEPVVHVKDGVIIPILDRDGNQVYRPFVDMKKVETLGKGHLIRKLKEGKYGTEIELVDSQGALKTLAQIHGLTGDERSAEDPMQRRSWREYLASLPPEVILGMHSHLLGASRAVIETTARAT